MSPMKQNTTYVLFGVTFALVASGLMGANILSTQPSGLVAQDTTPSSDGMGITGHVTTFATDTNGNIKAYRQTDNVVVNSGKDCVTKLLFGGSGSRGALTGTNTCKCANTAPWTSIAIGNQSGTVTVATTDYALTAEPVSNSNGLNRQLGTVSFTNATGSASSSTVIQTTFGPLTGLGTGGTQVTESGLFNSTTVRSAGGMFAHQAISSIALNNGDSLTIKWTINVG